MIGCTDVSCRGFPLCDYVFHRPPTKNVDFKDEKCPRILFLNSAFHHSEKQPHLLDTNFLYPSRRLFVFGGSLSHI